MTIIKHGRPKIVEESMEELTHVFECEECGCVFVVDRSEMKEKIMNISIGLGFPSRKVKKLYARCPECDTLLAKSDLK